MEILSDTQTRIAIDFQEAHALSVGLLDLMAQQELTVAGAVTAMLLSIQRLLHPSGDISDEEEAAFVQAALDWTAAYYTEGQAN